jgi:ATP-dependent RNA helicase RhlE
MTTDFASLQLVPPLQRALRDEGYTSPTPIQAQAIPPLLEGADLLGCARTGTGKTAAFALPILQRLFAQRTHAPRLSARALVMVPTRELATQVAQSFTAYGRHLHPTVAVIFGGVGQGPQVRALSRGVDVLVATPAVCST